VASVSRIDAGRLAGQIAGEVVMRGHHDYDVARRVWNGMIDRRPAVIVRCMSAVDVAAALDFASDAGLRVAVRGGSHNIAGNATCDDGPRRRPVADAVRRGRHRRSPGAGGRGSHLGCLRRGHSAARPQRYVDILRIIEPLFLPGRLNYWKANFADELSDELIDVLIDAMTRVPSPHTFIAIEPMGGAIARIPESATAFRHRSPSCSLLILSGWEDPADTDVNITWARELFALTEPLCSRPAWHGSSTSPTLPRRLRRYGLTAGWIEPKELSRDRTYSVDPW
jgi:hypothetical protein